MAASVIRPGVSSGIRLKDAGDKLKKIAFIIPVLVIAALGLSRSLSHQHSDCCPTPVPAIEIFPDTSIGVEVTVDYKMANPPKDSPMLFQYKSGTFRGRLHYWTEADGGRRLYLYDRGNHMVQRIENPEWVKIRREAP